MGASARMAVAAQRGQAPFKKAYKFNLLAFWGADLFMFVATPKAGLKTFGDYVSRKAKDGISVGPKGSGSYQVFDDVAKVHGTNFKAMEAWGAKIHYQYFRSLAGTAPGRSDRGPGRLWGQPSARIVDLHQQPEDGLGGFDKAASTSSARSSVRVREARQARGLRITATSSSTPSLSTPCAWPTSSPSGRTCPWDQAYTITNGGLRRPGLTW